MTSDFQRPVDKVYMVLTMGGSEGFTLGELSAATGYDAGVILGLIHRLRSDGVRVNAVEDGTTRSVGRALDRDNPHVATTVYRVVDSSSEKGVR